MVILKLATLPRYIIHFFLNGQEFILCISWIRDKLTMIVNLLKCKAI